MVVYAPPPPPPSCPLSAVSLSYEDELWTQRPTAGPLERPSNCSWYRESSCCSSEDVLRLSHADPVLSLVGSSLHCRDQLHLLMCSICSPAQADLYIVEDVGGFDVPVLRVCESFCETLFSACGGATLAEGGRRVDATFASGLEFCDAVGLRAVAAVDHSYCFSAAPPSLALSWWTWLLGALAACWLRLIQRAHY